MINSTNLTILLSCIIIWIGVYFCINNTNVHYDIIEVTYLAKDAGQHTLIISVDRELDDIYISSIKDYVKNQGIRYNSCDKFHINELPHLLSERFPSIQLVNIRAYDFNCQK